MDQIRYDFGWYWMGCGLLPAEARVAKGNGWASESVQTLIGITAGLIRLFSRVSWFHKVDYSNLPPITHIQFGDVYIVAAVRQAVAMRHVRAPVVVVENAQPPNAAVDPQSSLGAGAQPSHADVDRKPPPAVGADAQPSHVEVDPKPAPAVGADDQPMHVKVDPKPPPAVGADAQPSHAEVDPKPSHRSHKATRIPQGHISFPQGHTHEDLDAVFGSEAMFHHGQPLTSRWLGDPEAQLCGGGLIE